MAYTVRWSPEAVEDAELIAAWIRKDSPQHAGAVIDRLLEAAAGLNRNPLRGRVVPEFDDPAYREVFIYSYRLIYRVETDAVTIIAIIHGRRLLTNAREDSGR